MRRINYFYFTVFLAFLITSCGKPRLDSLTPASGPPHTIVETTGNTIFSDVLWDAGTASEVVIPGGWLGGGPFSVPATATLGNHQVGLTRDGEISDATIAFNVTAPVVTFPNPTITHLSSLFSGEVTGTPNRVKFMLFVQGPNIDIGAKIRVDGVENDSYAWKVFNYNSDGHDVTTLKYPIFHYAMVFTTIEADIGDNLTISVKNLDNNLSNNLTFTVPTEANWDSDGDSLLDTWEINGYDSNSDGVIDCDLPAMGANEYVYDIFVETDFMDGETAADPDKIPVSTIWPILEQSFANSPLINLMYGYQGIQLHIDRGQSSYTDLDGNVFAIPASEVKGGQILAFSDYIRMDSSNATFAAAGETTVNFYDLKSSNFDDSDRREIFHYAIFANNHGHSNGSSGRGEGYGNDLFITLPDFALALGDLSTGTFMHELGHNLNLKHGGDDDNSKKANHVSVMSYYNISGSGNNSYQFAGVDTDCNGSPDGIFDFSHGMLKDLDEASLNENIGLCDNTLIDWNNNTITENLVGFDIDGDGLTSNVLTDHNNWGEDFKFNFRDATDYND